MLQELNTFQQIAVLMLPLIFAVTLHEVAHGWVAYRLGDSTAKSLGRLSLNPIRHIDPFGTIILPTIMMLVSGFIFGWAKPVPVNFRQLHHPRRDIVLVAAAGPASNLLMAIFWAIIAKIGLGTVSSFPPAIFLIYTGTIGIYLNCMLMILNLLPILPLDGGRILHGLLPFELARIYARSEPFGLIIILALLFTNVLGYILSPLIGYSFELVRYIVNLELF